MRPTYSTHLADWLQQPRLPQGTQKILLDVGESLAGNGRSSHQYQVQRVRQVVLVQAKCLPQQPPRPIPLDGTADLAACHHSQARTRLLRQWPPIGDQAAVDRPLALLASSQKVPALLDSRRAAKPEPPSRVAAHARGFLYRG